MGPEVENASARKMRGGGKQKGRGKKGLALENRDWEGTKKAILVEHGERSDENGFSGGQSGDGDLDLEIQNVIAALQGAAVVAGMERSEWIGNLFGRQNCV